MFLGRPSDNSIWATTNLGEVFVWDSSQKKDTSYSQEIDLSGKECPVTWYFHSSFIPGSTVSLTGCMGDEADRIAINLNAPSTFKSRHKAHVELENTPLHFNPRFEEDCVVRNTLIEDNWGDEEKVGGMPFKAGLEFSMSIKCNEDDYLIMVNGKEFCRYRHRLPFSSVNSLNVWGKLQLFTLRVEMPEPILNPLDLLWRQMGGHLRRLESCKAGVTWGVGYDHIGWVYTGGWGGGYLGALDSNNLHPMTDTQDYRVYENQRWNPVTGYTSSMLPTDRYVWSDVTGKQKRTKDQVKLLSMRWQWISDWMIDFHVPGGVDSDGWQYAVDFPSTYHGRKQFTDYVRRRRWYRRCAVATTGPWIELGHTKLQDVSLEPLNDSLDSQIVVWALAAGGQAMLRYGVSRSCPAVNKKHPVNEFFDYFCFVGNEMGTR